MRKGACMGQKASNKKTDRLREHARRVSELLVQEYTTEYRCYLNHENAWQLLFATILSAQCTDARVNIVTADLFVKYPSIEAFATAELGELEKDIKSTGFYHNKAKNIIACARMLLEVYGGQVPDSIEELTRLPGVGRKTANVIRGNIYHRPSIVVDTHVKHRKKQRHDLDSFWDCEEKARQLVNHLEILSALPFPGVLNLYNRERLERNGAKIRDQRISAEPTELDVVTNFHVSQVLNLRRELINILKGEN